MLCPAAHARERPYTNAMLAKVTHQIAVRDMTAEDIRAVRRIERAAYQDAWPSRVFEQELENQFAHYRVAVVTSGEEASTNPWTVLRRRFGGGDESLVGFMGVWYMVDQMHLVTIASDPRHQGHGIGARLLLDCFDLCIEAELPSIALEVRVSNERAQRLYEHFGFQRMGISRQYYQDNGEDAVVMLAEHLKTPAGIEAHRERWRTFQERYGEAFANPAPPLLEEGEPTTK